MLGTLDEMRKTLNKLGKQFLENGGTIKSVSVFSTGTGEGDREHVYGTRKPALGWIFFGRQWGTPSINVFVMKGAEQK